MHKLRSFLVRVWCLGPIGRLQARVHIQNKPFFCESVSGRTRPRFFASLCQAGPDHDLHESVSGRTRPRPQVVQCRIYHARRILSFLALCALSPRSCNLCSFVEPPVHRSMVVDNVLVCGGKCHRVSGLDLHGDQGLSIRKTKQAQHRNSPGSPAKLYCGIMKQLGTEILEDKRVLTERNAVLQTELAEAAARVPPQ